MSLLDDILQSQQAKQIGGTAGKLINNYAKYVPVLGPLSQAIGDKNIGESLESFGGALGKFQLVPKANAWEGPGTTVSGDTTNYIKDQGLLDPLQAAQQQDSPGPSNVMDRSQDPGEGWFWDAALI
jgi:hypothetical protein